MLGNGFCCIVSGFTLKPMMTALEADARVTSDSLIAPTPPWITFTTTSSLDSFSKTGLDGFHRTLNICFDDQVQFFQIACLNLGEDVHQDSFVARVSSSSFSLFLGYKCLCKVSGIFFTVKCHKDFTGIRYTVQADDLNRCGRTCFALPAFRCGLSWHGLYRNCCLPRLAVPTFNVPF